MDLVVVGDQPLKGQHLRTLEDEDGNAMMLLIACEEDMATALSTWARVLGTVATEAGGE